MTGELGLGQDILLCLQEQVSLPLSPLPLDDILEAENQMPPSQDGTPSSPGSTTLPSSCSRLVGGGESAQGLQTTLSLSCLLLGPCNLI